MGMILRAIYHTSLFHHIPQRTDEIRILLLGPEILRITVRPPGLHPLVDIVAIRSEVNGASLWSLLHGHKDGCGLHGIIGLIGLSSIRLGQDIHIPV